MMRNSSYQAVPCNTCDELMRVKVRVAEAFGGDMYCDECIEEGEVPENHPQHPEYDGDFRI